MQGKFELTIVHGIAFEGVGRPDRATAVIRGVIQN